MTHRNVHAPVARATTTASLYDRGTFSPNAEREAILALA
jgi:hypothetical protein